MTPEQRNGSSSDEEASPQPDPEDAAAKPSNTGDPTGHVSETNEPLSGLGRLLERIPFKLLLGFIVLSLMVKEWYPISHYPMYANPPKNHWYVYVSDGEDQALPLQTVFGLRTAFLKKLYRDRLEKMPKQAAAEATLAYVYEEGAKVDHEKPSKLRLWRMNLQAGKHSISRKPELLGEIAAPE